MLQTRRVLFALVAVLAIASVACSSDSSSSSAGTTATSPAGGGTAIAATEKDFSIALDLTEVAAGEVTFTINNEGPSAHEFVVIADRHAPGDLAREGWRSSRKIASTVVDEAEDIAPSTTAPTAHRPRGRFLRHHLQLPGHYEQGMNAGLTVT